MRKTPKNLCALRYVWESRLFLVLYHSFGTKTILSAKLFTGGARCLLQKCKLKKKVNLRFQSKR